MSEESEVLFILKELIPFYSIAFAVNMAFGFWDSLRDVYIKKFEILSLEKNESFSNALKIQGSKPNQCLEDFKTTVDTKKQTLNKISIMGKFGCAFMCLILATSIAYLGMYTDTEMPFYFTTFTIIGSVLPFTIMMLASCIYSKVSLSDIDKTTKEQLKGMKSVLDDATDAYRKQPT